ncbi:hypothetical protein, partial [uncultured Winogradskyella sp.]|uniref:hypothetical protein n=1 Tax=uncultured Winogradskyella sp. TaxID=395353 RepID=UPI0030DCFC03
MFVLNVLQRVRVWFLRWLATKLVKENEPEEIPKDFLLGNYQAIDYTCCCAFVIFLFTYSVLPKIYSFNVRIYKDFLNIKCIINFLELLYI